MEESPGTCYTCFQGDRARAALSLYRRKRHLHEGVCVMGYLGEEIRKLGFGLMRLPQKDGVIDVEET